MKKKLRIFAGMTIASVLLAPVGAIAQTEWEIQARDILSNEAETYLPDYTLERQLMFGSLNSSANQTRTIRLQGGVEYAILGACDIDCSDLDLSLFDRANTLIDADGDTDAVPMVTVIPNRTANYRIRAEMYQCSNQPCYYAIGVFRR